MSECCELSFGFSPSVELSYVSRKSVIEWRLTPYQYSIFTSSRSKPCFDCSTIPNVFRVFLESGSQNFSCSMSVFIVSSNWIKLNEIKILTQSTFTYFQISNAVFPGLAFCSPFLATKIERWIMVWLRNVYGNSCKSETKWNIVKTKESNGWMFMWREFERWNIIIVLNVFTRKRHHLNVQNIRNWNLVLASFFLIFWIELAAWEYERKCVRVDGKSAAANQQIDICKHSRNKLLCMQRSRVRNLKWVFHCKPWVKRGRWAWCVSVFFFSLPNHGWNVAERTNEWAESESQFWFMTITEKWWRVVPSAQRTCQLWRIRIFRNNKLSSLSNAQCDFSFFFLVPAFFHVDFVFPTSLLQHFLKNLPLFALFQRSNTNEYGSMVQQKDENLSRQT